MSGLGQGVKNAGSNATGKVTSIIEKRKMMYEKLKSYTKDGKKEAGADASEKMDQSEKADLNKDKSQQESTDKFEAKSEEE